MEGFIRESLLQEQVDGKARSNVCERRCLIVPGGLGWCRTRENNVSGHRGANTYCPACGATLIHRSGYDVLWNTLRHGQCPRCGRRLAGVWGTRDKGA